MSWDAELIDDRGRGEGSWNFTHNCSGMANTAAREAGLGQLIHDRQIARWRALGRDDIADHEAGNPDYGTWWAALDGMPGPAGAAFLHAIIRGLEADPARFEALNPPNGWGDYDSFLKVLRDMRDAVPEWPTTWTASG